MFTLSLFFLFNLQGSVEHLIPERSSKAIAEPKTHGLGQLPVLFGLTSLCLLVLIGFPGYLTNVLTHSQPHYQTNLTM